MNSESRLVTYVNKKGERQTLPLNQALESNNAEMTKRLKYTKDILTHMLNNNNRMPTAGSTIGGGAGSSTAMSNGMNTASSRMQTIGSALSSKRVTSDNLIGTGSSTAVRSAAGGS